MDNRFLKSPILWSLTAITIFTLTSCGKTHNTPDNSAQAATEVLEIAEEYQDHIQADTQTDTQTDIPTDTQTDIPTDTQTETYKNEKSVDSFIPEIRTLLSDENKNGKFSNYQEAYEEIARLTESGNDINVKCTYNLIYIDEDDIPELSAGPFGVHIDLYTYEDGKLYLLMDHRGYGAGNSGYHYAPKQNSIRLDDQDFAGALLHTMYWKINEEHAIENIVTIDTYYFDDLNGNGLPDNEEITDDYRASYIDGIEVSEETCSSYDKGQYEPIVGEMTFDELMEAL